MELTSQLNERTLQIDPLTKVLTTTPELYGGELRAMQFGTGIIDVNRQNSLLLPARFLCATLASAGMENHEIGAALDCSIDSVKHNLQNTYNKLRISTRGGLARYMFKTKTFTIRSQGARLGISNTEKPVIELFSTGLTREGVANKLGRSSHFVRARLDAVADRNCLRGKQDVVLAALLSGEIGNFALRGATSERQ